MKEQGMGRTRMGRFAAITVPAAVATAGMGFAMVQGMVGAVISSTGGFELKTDLSAAALKVRTGATEVGTAGNNKETIYAETTGSVANGLDVKSPKVAILPGLDFGLSITSTDTAIDLGDVSLNAQDLATGGATLSNVALGQAQSVTAFSPAGQVAGTGYHADGFSLAAAGAAGSQVLPDVDSTAYAVTLGGLDLSQLTIALY